MSVWLVYLHLHYSLNIRWDPFSGRQWQTDFEPPNWVYWKRIIAIYIYIYVCLAVMLVCWIYHMINHHHRIIELLIPLYPYRSSSQRISWRAWSQWAPQHLIGKGQPHLETKFHRRVVWTWKTMGKTRRPTLAPGNSLPLSPHINTHQYPNRDLHRYTMACSSKHCHKGGAPQLGSLSQKEAFKPPTTHDCCLNMCTKL